MTPSPTFNPVVPATLIRPPSPPPEEQLRSACDRIFATTILASVDQFSEEVLADFLASTEEGHPIRDGVLNIWAMQVYKRYIRILNSQRRLYDIFTVGSNVMQSINNLIQQKDIDAGAKTLREMWDLLGQEESPKQVVLLGPHGLDPSRWIVQVVQSLVSSSSGRTFIS